MRRFIYLLKKKKLHFSGAQVTLAESVNLSVVDEHHFRGWPSALKNSPYSILYTLSLWHLFIAMSWSVSFDNLGGVIGVGLTSQLRGSVEKFGVFPHGITDPPSQTLWRKHLFLFPQTFRSAHLSWAHLLPLPTLVYLLCTKKLFGTFLSRKSP